MSCTCNKIPKITKGNDFKLSLHMTETMCNGGIIDLDGTITSVNLVSSNGSKISVHEGAEENGKIKYHDIGDSTIIIAVLNPLPLGKYGVEVNGTRNIDNSDFRYFNDYVFEIVKTSADGFIPCNSTMTYSIVGANVGLATSIVGSSIEQVQSDWAQTDSSQVDYIKNKPNVYEKPNGGIPKSDLANDVQASLSKADTAIQSLNGYATEQWVNNQGFLTQHQSLDGYATESWVTNQGYLTEHQDLSDYATKEDVEKVTSIFTTDENGIYFTDEHGNVFMRYDNNGFDTIKVNDHFKGLVADQVLTSGSTYAVSSKAVYQWVNNQGYLTQHQTVDQVLTSGSTNAVSSKAVYDALADNEYVIAQALTDLNTRLGGKEDKIGITVYSASTSSIQLQMSYNRVDFAVGTMAFTLPTVTSSDYLQGLIVSFTTDTTPSVTVTSTNTVIYADGSDLTEIEASTPYELNAIWDGAKWKITLTKFIAA